MKDSIKELLRESLKWLSALKIITIMLSYTLEIS